MNTIIKPYQAIQIGYKSFQPNFINKQWNIDLFINMHVLKEVTGLSLPTVYKLLSDLEKLEILKEVTGSKREKLYGFYDYMVLFK